MGALTEINALIRLTDEIDKTTLKLGQQIRLHRNNNRVIPAGVALLMTDNDWRFYGYGKVISLTTSKDSSELVVEVLTLFNDSESNLYREKFIEAGRLTGEV